MADSTFRIEISEDDAAGGYSGSVHGPQDFGPLFERMGERKDVLQKILEQCQATVELLRVMAGARGEAALAKLESSRADSPPTPGEQAGPGKGRFEAALDAAGSAARRFSSVLESLGSNDNAGGVAGAARGVSAALSLIPGPGMVLSKVLDVCVGAVTAFSNVVEAFVQRGKTLSQYSGDLSVANARADVRGMYADIREAQELGPSLARLTDAQSEVSTAFRELMLPIKKAIVDEIVPILQVAAREIRELPATLQLVSEVPDMLRQAFEQDRSFSEIADRRNDELVAALRDQTRQREEQMRQMLDPMNQADAAFGARLVFPHPHDPLLDGPPPEPFRRPL